MTSGYIGDQLQLFKALRAADTPTSDELAEQTGLADRDVLNWLHAMVAAGHADFDPGTGRYEMSEEQAQWSFTELSEVFASDTFYFTIPSLDNLPRIVDALRGNPVLGHGWGDLARRPTISHLDDPR